MLCNAKKIVRHGHTLHMCLVIVIFHDISKVIAIISSPFSLIYIWFIVSTAFSVFFSKKKHEHLLSLRCLLRDFKWTWFPAFNKNVGRSLWNSS